MRLVGAAALVVLASTAAPARAQTSAHDAAPEATPESDAEARAAFERGRDAFAEGDYDVALHEFERAYALSGRAALLYNIGTTYDRLRNDARAIEHFEAYLEHAPDAENRRSVERRLSILRSRAEQPAPEPGGGVSPWPFVTLGAGAALGVLSGVFWALAKGADDELATTCSPGCSDVRIDQTGGPAYVALTNVFLIAAIVAGAASVTWLVLDLVLGGDDAPEAAASLRLSPLGASGRF